MNLKEFAKVSDEALFSPEIFGERHLLNGREALVVIDQDRDFQNLGRVAQNPSMIPGTGSLLLFVRKADYAGSPESKTRIYLDKKAYVITDVRDEDTIWKLTIEQSRG